VWESSRDKVVRSARERVVAQAYRHYAELVVEHERLRRARWDLERDAPWQPALAAWNTLRFLAEVHDLTERAARVLVGFFTRHGAGVPFPVSDFPLPMEKQGGQGASPSGALGKSEIGNRQSEIPRVPCWAWKEALEAGIDLVADVLVSHRAELPWGRGKPRAPRKAEDFERRKDSRERRKDSRCLFRRLFRRFLTGQRRASRLAPMRRVRWHLPRRCLAA